MIAKKERGLKFGSGMSQGRLSLSLCVSRVHERKAGAERRQVQGQIGSHVFPIIIWWRRMLVQGITRVRLIHPRRNIWRVSCLFVAGLV